MNKKSLILESAVQGNVSIANRTNDTIRFIAVLQEANKPNRNGRIYPKEHIDAALKHPIIQEKLRTKTWFMEVGHPMTQDIMRQRTPDLNNVCCIIEDYWWEGNTLKAHCQTTKTRGGYDMKGLLEQGCQLSFSMRGTGDVVDDPRTGQKIVGSNLQITTYDWVWLPSHPEAYMDSLCESTQALMFNINQYSNRNVALCESMDLFENGAVINLESNTPELKSYDYSKKYYQKYKKLCEAYQYNSNDKVIGLSENKLTVKLHNEEEFADKVVMVEDYVIKSTRNQLNTIISEAADSALIKQSHMSNGWSWSKDGKYDEEMMTAKGLGYIKSTLGLTLLSLIPLAGLPAAIATSVRQNNNLERINSEHYKELRDYVKNDKHCQEIIKKIKRELLDVKPDGKKLKELRNEFNDALKAAKEEYKEKLTEALTLYEEVTKLEDEEDKATSETSDDAELEKETPSEEEILGTEVDADDVKTDEDELEDLTKDQATVNESIDSILTSLRNI